MTQDDELFVLSKVMSTIRSAFREWELTRSSPATPDNKEFVFHLASKLETEHGFVRRTPRSDA